jgi:hypothetical protein
MTTNGQITLGSYDGDTLCFGSSKKISFTDGNTNSYFYNNSTTSSIDEPRLEPNLLPNASNISTFTYDFWVKPEKTIGLPNVNNTCTNNWDLYYSQSNWALMATHGGSSYYGIGVSVGTNGICVGEHKANLLTSRITYQNNLSGWNHIALSVRTDSMFLYLNGSLIGARGVNCQSLPRLLTNTFAQGFLNPSNVYNQAGAFIGGLDEIRVWNGSLSASQINYIKDKKLSNSLPNLIYYVNFDNGFNKTFGSHGTQTMGVFGYSNANIIMGGVNLNSFSGNSISNLTQSSTTYYYNGSVVTNPFYVQINNSINNVQVQGICGFDTTYSNTITIYGKNCCSADTNYINVYDTIQVPYYYDVPVMVYDTTYVTIYDTIRVNVYDTLFIDFNKWGYGTNGILNINVETIKVYPIPTMGSLGLNIDVNGLANSNYQHLFYSLYNNVGQVVYSGQILNQLTTLNISTLSSGAYTLQFYDNSSQIATKQIVITN